MFNLLNNFKKSLLAVSLGLLMGLTACNSNPTEKYYKSIPQEFDAMCQRAIDEWKVPGMAVAVVNILADCNVIKNSIFRN